MPRPIKDDPRDRFKTFRFTEAEITRLEARARASGRSLSDYVRAKVFDGLGGESPADSDREPSTWRPGSPKARPEIPPGRQSPEAGGPSRRRAEFSARMLAEQMRRVGVNLNQIAHRMNERRDRPPRGLIMLIDEIRAYVRQAREP